MNADELISSSKEIQEKWLRETKIDFSVIYEYLGCIVDDEDPYADSSGEVYTYTELKCKEETIYAFFNGWSNHVDGYYDLNLFGIYKNVEEGKDIVSKLDNFAC
jgi:hypothetical protein